MQIIMWIFRIHDCPHNAPDFKTAIRMGAETFHALKSVLSSKGYALQLEMKVVSLLISSQMKKQLRQYWKLSLRLVINLVTTSPSASILQQVRCGIMVPTSFKSTKNKLTSEQMVEHWENWVKKYPIVSIEDGMGENDKAGWKLLTEKLGKKIELVGDDLFCTNPSILAENS